MEQEQTQVLSAQQERKGVQKDYYFFNGSEYLYNRLLAQSSSLFFKKEENGVELIELMHLPSYRGYDRTNPSRLQIVEAQEGVYHYTQQTLTAPDLMFRSSTHEKTEVEGRITDASFYLRAGVRYTGKETFVRLAEDVTLKSPLSKWNAEQNTLVLERTPTSRPILKQAGNFVEADQMTFSPYGEGWRVVAKGDVKGNLHLFAFEVPQTLSVQIQKIDERQQLTTLIAEGITRIESQQQQFICKGLLTINHRKGELIAQSPVGGSKEHLFFQDPLFSGYARSLHMTYDPQSLVVGHVLLKGEVRLRNLFSAEVAPLEQYALADEVHINPVAKTMELKGKGDTRVLFLDSANHMQVSAKALNITYDKEKREPIIKGVGDVRLIFGEEELNKMKSWVQAQ